MGRNLDEIYGAGSHLAQARGPLVSQNRNFMSRKEAESYGGAKGASTSFLSSILPSRPADRSIESFAIPTVSTVNFDGGTKFLSAIGNTAGAVLSALGSSGDGDIVAQPVSGQPSAYQSGGGMLENPLVIVGGIMAIGAVLYFAGK